MKKIAIISNSYFPNIWNGPGRSTFAIAYGLAKKGYDVSVFTFTPKAETFKQQDGQVIVYYIGGVSDPTVSALPFSDIAIWNERMLPLLLCEKFDTIILNNWHGITAATKYATAKIIGIAPFLYSFTGWLKPLGFALEQEMRVLEAEFLTRSDVLVTHTTKFGQKVSNYTNKDVFIIPNCYLDLSIQKQESFPVVPYQICAIGRVNRERNLERIIRVMPDLPDATLVVASPESSAGYFGSLTRLAKLLDVEHRIRFTGWLNTKDTRDLYVSSAVAVVPSQFEPFGYGVIDPMALGVPVVISEWSCLEEYLGNNDTVFNSLEGLKEQLAKVFKTSPKQRLETAYNNALRLRSELSEETITNLLVQVL